MNNQESSREQSNVSNSRFQFETSKSNSNNQELNNREISQALKFDQMNVVIFYNCDKSDHIARRYLVSRKMNSNNFVRNIKKNTFDQESKKE